MSRLGFLTANAWPDGDGKHVWVAHDCVNGRDISMLPYPQWRIGDGKVEPSFSHDVCGIHAFIDFGHPEKPS